MLALAGVDGRALLWERRPTEVEQLPEVISVDEAPIHAAHAGQGGGA